MAGPVVPIAEELAKKQKEISVSEFFERNKQLLGFDSPTRAILTAVKEAVDNSLDACEEAAVLPDILVTVDETDKKRGIYHITIEDNGPGIVRQQIPNVFARLLYGSRFHAMPHDGHNADAFIAERGRNAGQGARAIQHVGAEHPMSFLRFVHRFLVPGSWFMVYGPQFAIA